MQFRELHRAFDRLQRVHGARGLKPVYGAGCTHDPRAMFVFMNPTAQNISTHPSWKGLRAPWLGTKNVWHLFYRLGFLLRTLFRAAREKRPDEWSPRFASEIYAALAARGAYVTNLAKCTQTDARPLKNEVFRAYRDLLFREIALAKPEHVITLGNQVSSVVLGKPISVSDYMGARKEALTIGRTVFAIYPTYYPVGQGRKNFPRSVRRIASIIA